MTLPDGIQPDQLKVAAIVALGVLVVLLFLIMRVIQKMVLRVILAGVLVAAGVFVYAQRSNLDTCQKDIRVAMSAKGAEVRCTCTFAGFDVTVPRCPLAPVRGG